MSTFTDFIKRQHRIYIGAYIDDMRDRRDVEAFRVSGTEVYIGRQGSGKTVSAVHQLLKIKERYPRCKVITNLILNVDFEYTRFETAEELQDLLINESNDKYGIVYLIDEIHTYFNALESKGIPPYIFTEILQQRKQRKVIIGTSQLFMRIAKPFREQCDNMIKCNTWFGVWTFQKAFDGMTVEQEFDGSLTGDVKKRGWFWHSRKLRSSFDTYQKVITAKTQMMAMVDPVRPEWQQKGYKKQR